MALTEFTNALFKNALADGPEHEAEHTSLEVLAVGYDYCVDIGRAVRLTREGIGVAGTESMLMMAPSPALANRVAAECARHNNAIALRLTTRVMSSALCCRNLAAAFSLCQRC